MGLCPSAVDKAAKETLWGVRVTSTRPWRFLGLQSPGMGRSGTQPGVGGGPLPSPGIQLFRLGQEFRPLWTVHMAQWGPFSEPWSKQALRRKDGFLLDTRALSAMI